MKFPKKLPCVRIEWLPILVSLFAVALIVYFSQKKEGFECKPSELDSFINNPEKTIVLFYADWCGHCTKMKPEWEKTAEKANAENKRMLKINVGDKTEEQEALLSKYKINGFPTVLVFQKGTPSPYEGEYTESMFLSLLN